MEIGRLIVEDINTHENKEDYQSKTISMLSKELTKKFGRGFSRANILNMITFYFHIDPLTIKISEDPALPEPRTPVIKNIC